MSDSFLREIIHFSKTDLGQEETQELFTATVRSIVSNHYINALQRGVSIEELAQKADMTVEEFKNAVQCSSYDHISTLGKITYALDFELSFELNSKEKEVSNEY